MGSEHILRYKNDGRGTGGRWNMDGQKRKKQGLLQQ